MDALEILQKVFRQAGGPGNDPVTILNPTGFTRDCMDWVNTSWRWVQALRQDWWWKWVTTEQSLTIGKSQYDPLVPWVLPDVRYFDLNDVVLWDPAVGVSDQGTLKLVSAKDWRSKWDIRDPDNNRPTEVAQLEAGSLGFGSPPDKAYSIRLRYYQKNTDFASNTDVPGIPEEYHELIVQRALMLWAAREENQLKYRTYEVEVQRWEKLLNADAIIGTGYGNASGTLG